MCDVRAGVVDARRPAAPISQEAMIAGSHEHISYHMPSGPAQTNAHLDAIARDLGPNNKVIERVLSPHFDKSH